MYSKQLYVTDTWLVAKGHFVKDENSPWRGGLLECRLQGTLTSTLWSGTASHCDVMSQSPLATRPRMSVS